MSTIHLTVLDLDTATARALTRCSSHAGTGAFTVRPDTRRPAWLARDLLAAVGIRHGLSGQTRRDADDRQLVPIWLAAHHVHDVIAVGIEALNPALLPELVELTVLAGANLWLVADHLLPDATTETLADWPVRPCPPDEFRARWLDDVPPAPEAREPVTAPSDELPTEVPQADFTLFRATARRQLPDTAFARLDDRFVRELDAALVRLDAGDGPLDILRDATGRCQSASAVAVTVRAVQAAVWRRGQHLRVDLDALLAFDDHTPVATAADPATWPLLHAYRQPVRQAACALLLLDVAIQTQTTLTLADLDVARPAVRVDGVWRSLPAEARPTLQALRTSRLAAGAEDDDPLLAKLDGSPASTRALADAANTVRQETGLRLTVGQVEREPVPTTRWARRRHVTATALEV